MLPLDLLYYLIFAAQGLCPAFGRSWEDAEASETPPYPT